MHKDSFQQRFNDEYQKYLAKNHRFSLRSFARFLGLAPSTIHQYLSGRYAPSRRNLELIAQKLNWPESVRQAYEENMVARPVTPDKTEVFDGDSAALPINEITVKILALSKEKEVPSDVQKLLPMISVATSQTSDVQKALDLLQAQDLIETQGPLIKFKYNVKFVATETPEGEFLNFQKQALRRMENALTEVPKADRLLLLGTIQIDKSELGELSQEINRFAEKIRRRFGKSNSKEMYQVILGATPFR